MKIMKIKRKNIQKFKNSKLSQFHFIKSLTPKFDSIQINGLRTPEVKLLFQFSTDMMREVQHDLTFGAQPDKCRFLPNHFSETLKRIE